MCADECITEKYYIDISSQPLKGIDFKFDHYFINLYFEDFDFVTVTYHGKVKINKISIKRMRFVLFQIKKNSFSNWRIILETWEESWASTLVHQ
jgi:hypothetical protein